MCACLFWQTRGWLNLIAIGSIAVWNQCSYILLKSFKVGWQKFQVDNYHDNGSIQWILSIGNNGTSTLLGTDQKWRLLILAWNAFSRPIVPGSCARHIESTARGSGPSQESSSWKASLRFTSFSLNFRFWNFRRSRDAAHTEIKNVK